MGKGMLYSFGHPLEFGIVKVDVADAVSLTQFHMEHHRVESHVTEKVQGTSEHIDDAGSVRWLILETLTWVEHGRVAIVSGNRYPVMALASRFGLPVGQHYKVATSGQS